MMTNIQASHSNTNTCFPNIGAAELQQTASRNMNQDQEEAQTPWDREDNKDVELHNPNLTDDEENEYEEIDDEKLDQLEREGAEDKNDETKEGNNFGKEGISRVDLIRFLFYKGGLLVMTTTTMMMMTMWQWQHLKVPMTPASMRIWQLMARSGSCSLSS